MTNSIQDARNRFAFMAWTKSQISDHRRLFLALLGFSAIAIYVSWSYSTLQGTGPVLSFRYELQHQYPWGEVKILASGELKARSPREGEKVIFQIDVPYIDTHDGSIGLTVQTFLSSAAEISLRSPNPDASGDLGPSQRGPISCGRDVIPIYGAGRKTLTFWRTD